MNPRYLLYIFTFVAQMVGGMLPVLWFHDRVSDKFLVLAGCAAVVFFYLIGLHPPPERRLITFMQQFIC